MQTVLYFCSDSAMYVNTYGTEILIRIALCLVMIQIALYMLIQIVLILTLVKRYIDKCSAW